MTTEQIKELVARDWADTCQQDTYFLLSMLYSVLDSMSADEIRSEYETLFNIEEDSV